MASSVFCKMDISAHLLIRKIGRSAHFLLRQELESFLLNFVSWWG